MSEEELRAIEERVATQKTRCYTLIDADQAFRDREGLLAEVRRLRAENTALWVARSENQDTGSDLLRRMTEAAYEEWKRGQALMKQLYG